MALWHQLFIPLLVTNHIQKTKRIEKGQFELINEYCKLLKGESRNTDLPSVVDGVKATICSLKVLDALKTGKVQKWDYVFS
jgi:hypothetical protein